MNKPATIAMALLMVVVGYCGYRAHNLTPAELQGKDRFGSWYRVREPQPPPIAPEQIQRDADAYFRAAAVAAANKADEKLTIRGVHIATIDQRAMSRAMAREVSNVHE